MSVEKFLESLKNLIARKGEIAGMLSLDLGGGSEKLGYLAKSSDYEKICNSEKMFPVAFSSTTTFYLRTCVLLFDNDIQAAAETHRNMLQALLKTYSKEVLHLLIKMYIHPCFGLPLLISWICFYYFSGLLVEQRSTRSIR